MKNDVTLNNFIIIEAMKYWALKNVKPEIVVGYGTIKDLITYGLVENWEEENRTYCKLEFNGFNLIVGDFPFGFQYALRNL
jgi:hypothetical protein